MPRARARRRERRVRRGGEIVPLAAERRPLPAAQEAVRVIPDGLLVARREFGAEAAQAAEVDAGAGRDEEPQRPAQAGERLPGPGHLVQLPGGVSERAG